MRCSPNLGTMGSSFTLTMPEGKRPRTPLAQPYPSMQHENEGLRVAFPASLPYLGHCFLLLISATLRALVSYTAFSLSLPEGSLLQEEHTWLVLGAWSHVAGEWTDDYPGLTPLQLWRLD